MQNVPGTIFRKEKPNPDKVDELHKVLELYETILSKNEYVAGSHLTIAGEFKKIYPNVKVKVQFSFEKGNRFNLLHLICTVLFLDIPHL